MPKLSRCQIDGHLDIDGEVGVVFYTDSDRDRHVQVSIRSGALRINATVDDVADLIVALERAQSWVEFGDDPAEPLGQIHRWTRRAPAQDDA